MSSRHMHFHVFFHEIYIGKPTDRKCFTSCSFDAMPTSTNFTPRTFLFHFSHHDETIEENLGATKWQLSRNTQSRHARFPHTHIAP